MSSPGDSQTGGTGLDDQGNAQVPIPGQNPAIPQPTEQGLSQQGSISTDTTSPVNSHSKVRHPLTKDLLTAPLWLNSTHSVAVGKNVDECLKSPMPNTKGNVVAMSIVTEAIPSDWAEIVSTMDTAHEALEWFKRKFQGGHNTDAIQEAGVTLDQVTIEPRPNSGGLCHPQTQSCTYAKYKPDSCDRCQTNDGDY